MKRAFLLACLLLFCSRLAAAQPLQLFNDGPPPAAPQDPVTGQWRAPAGDWRAYLSWIKSQGAPDGLSIAYLDSGINADHPLIRPLLKEAIDLTGEGAQDDIGHGTMVALIGILASKGVFAPIISVKIAGRNPQLNGAQLLEEGLKVALDKGAFVANVSAGVDIGCVNSRDPNGSPFLLPCEDTPICKFIAGKPMLVVAAVGNTPGKTACPACCKSALAVGAADENGHPTSYSGAFPDILAPGHVLIGPLPNH